jgi:prepilin-type N-terminal cleavage/methylation domain-containing protein
MGREQFRISDFRSQIATDGRPLHLARGSRGLHRRSIRGGFTLVELMAVLFILAAVAGAAAIRVGPALGKVKAHDAAGRVAAFDARMRTICREQDRALQMVVELDGGRMRLAGDDGRDLPVPPLELPDGLWLSMLLLRGQEIQRGAAAISCSREGLSPSYAIRLEGPGAAPRWLVVCGLTGGVIQEGPCDDKRQREIREIISSVTPRDDAR